MLFQQHMRLPIDTELLPINNRADGSLDDTDRVVDTLLESRAKSYSSANHNITYAQEKQKETYDRKHQPDEFPEGSEVMLENTKQKQRKGGKCDPMWLGPYLIRKKACERWSTS